MDPSAYTAFTEALRSRLASEPDVLGLVALGSTSGLPPAPDAFSDHDFFVIVTEGRQEGWRTDLSWLPDASRLAFTFRETAHGLKALWDDGHLAEFAVFSPAELDVARVNRYAVLLDRADVAARVERVRAATIEQRRATRPDERWSVGMFLGALVVGAGRWARGERLCARQLLDAAATGHLLTILRATLDPGRAGRLDSLDPTRRVEQALPEEAPAILAALALPAPAAGRALLDLLLRRRPGRVSASARAAVERALDAAERP